MGIGIVLLIWAVVGTFLAALGGFVLGGATAFFTCGVAQGRRVTILAAFVFPFVCLCWAGFVFVFQAIVNEAVLHRDPGLGDSWHCPVPNGYQILMVDVTDQGTVYNPKTQPVSGGVVDREDAVSGVRTLQVSGQYIAGGVDRNAFEHLGETSNQIDFYFLLDTRTGKRTEWPNYDALRNAMAQRGISANLEPIDTVYGRYRLSWFEVFAGLLFLVPPIIGVRLRVRRVVRLRRTRVPSPVAA